MSWKQIGEIVECVVSNIKRRGNDMTYKEEMFCSICGELNDEWPGGRGYGNNAEPVNDGRCCNWCNGTVVLPARMTLIEQKTAN